MPPKSILSRLYSQYVIKAREIKPIETTFELSKIIEESMPKSVIYKRGGADKKVFQAIRIEVNNELDRLFDTIVYLGKSLKSGGRMAVLTFHSLEDRIVKNAFKELTTDCICPPKTPICICHHKKQGILINKKPITATDEELANNSRASCAKLRIFEKI